MTLRHKLQAISRRLLQHYLVQIVHRKGEVKRDRHEAYFKSKH
jgi:hypothetical protein